LKRLGLQVANGRPAAERATPRLLDRHVFHSSAGTSDWKCGVFHPPSFTSFSESDTSS
jgi:hypothetical protein